MNPLAWLLACITGSIAFWSMLFAESWLSAFAWAFVLLLAGATAYEEIRAARRAHERERLLEHQRHSSIGGAAERMP